MAVTDAKQRILDALKRVRPASAAELAETLGLTPTAVRQHLVDLESHGLVRAEASRPSGRGRPSSRWALTDVATGLFPDHHADLTVDLIAAVRRAVGEDGLRKVIDARGRDQVRAYRSLLPPPKTPLVRRVEALARRRSAEGYMAEAVPAEDGSVLLVEHHCPICAAASACQGLCRSELEVFQTSLGAGVTVEREQHLLSGDARCVYRIRRAPSGGG